MIKVLNFMRELSNRFELHEKVWHHAFGIFVRAFDKNPKMKWDEMKEVAVGASELAIKFHDIDERVQLLEQANWTLKDSGDKIIDQFEPLTLEKFWKIERDLLLLMDWRIDELKPYDFSEVFQEFGILFPGDTFEKIKGETSDSP